MAMRRALPRKTTFNRARWFLHWCSSGFLLVGMLALGYYGVVWANARLYQVYQSWRFDHTVQHPSSPTGLAVSPGSEIGRIEIPSIGLSAMVAEGADEATLRVAVGHISGTALPGQPGNVGMAGHRDTFFRGLRQIRKNDAITLTTLSGAYQYRVEAIQVVSPDNTEVLAATSEPSLTLVTCYPFSYVGSAPERFVVRARQCAPSGREKENKQNPG